MQNIKKYYIKDLIDKSKRIVVINYYSRSTVYDGSYEDCPEFLLNLPMEIFTPYEDRYEFMAWEVIDYVLYRRCC